MAIIRAVDEFGHLFGHRALRLHPLSGDRAGQYAMSMTGNFRLIIERISEEKVRILGPEDYPGN